jgi:hypothetical protein
MQQSEDMEMMEHCYQQLALLQVAHHKPFPQGADLLTYLYKKLLVCMNNPQPELHHHSHAPPLQKFPHLT